MKIGFFLALRTDVQHYLHAASLVREARAVMPNVEIVQFSDEHTPEVPSVSTVRRKESAGRHLLDLRLRHYADCDDAWLLLDTDVSVRADVGHVFDNQGFDIALCDRNWPHLPQGERILQEMPFNTGVCFSRTHGFWQDVLDVWRRFDPSRRDNWMSEQLAVYEVVRWGKYLVKILPGMVYNYPPEKQDDAPATAAIVHFKGPRKEWLSPHATRVLSQPVPEPVDVPVMVTR